MAEDQKKVTPDAENEAVESPADDKVITEIADAIEKKLHENEDENVLVEAPPKPSDDDVLSELKEALDKAERNEDADDILTGNALKASEKKYETITEEDFKVPDEKIEADEVTLDAEAADIAGDEAKAPEQSKGNWQTKTADRSEKRQASSDDGGANHAKKRNPAKIIIFILAFLLVGAGVFALVHYVITPSLDASNSGNTSSQTGTATKDELETVAPTETGSMLMASKAMESMSRREKICQLFIVTPERLMNSESTVTQADDTTKSSLNSYPVGGVIFTQRNLTGEDQAKALITDTQNYSKTPLFIAVDDDGIITSKQDAQNSGGPEGGPQGGPEGGPQGGPEGGPQGGPEGGPQGGPEGQAPSEKTDDTSAEGAYEDAVNTSEEKQEVGFNLDFSLDADVSDARESNPDLTDAEANTLLSSAVKGYNEGGVIPSLKYFPGKEKTDSENSENSESSSSTDEGFIHISQTADELNTGSEFTAFRSGIEAGAGMIMVNHVFVDKLDTEKPATLSSRVVPDLLRQKLNYQGVAVTGNMSADYFTTEYSYSTIVKGIFASDIDMILNPNSIQSYVEEIEKKLDSGEITEDQLNTKVKRILTLKYDKGIITESSDSEASTESSATTASTEASATTETKSN